ncbi:MAG: sulfatase [Myxococcota bacterium]
MTAQHRVAAALSALLGLGACAPADELLQPVQRLVDLVSAKRVFGPPVAAIGDETRLVLRSYASGDLAGEVGARVPADRRLSLRLKLPRMFTGASRLVVVPLVRDAVRWITVPQQVVEVQQEASGEFVRVEFELPEAIAGDRVDVAIRGHALPEGGTSSIETPAVEVPARATLEFGAGILEPAQGQGPVEFSVQACADGDCAPVLAETLDPSQPAGRGWRNYSVSLAPWAGQVRSFRFETTLRRTAAGSFSLPVWSNPTIYTERPRTAADVNVILLSVDTLRADHLPSYGYPLDTAPFLDEKLAAEGTLFEAFVAAATTTGPAHMSMFASLPPSAHGIGTVSASLPPRAVTLAEALRAVGFETAAVTEDGPLNARQFRRGFDSFAENKSPRVHSPTGQVDLTFERARHWLERHKHKRFFLFLHTFQVHFPYAPPPEYEGLFPDPAEGREAHPDLPPERDPRLYAREIRYVDDQLRSFFDFLESEGLAGDTVLVFTSDHGDAFLEHGFWGHGAEVYSETTHVPLVFHGPGVARGRRVSVPVGHVDLAPTLLELAGVARPAAFTGRSFADLLRADGPVDGRPPSPVYSEAWYRWGARPGGKPVRVAQPTFSVRVGDRKLVRYRRGKGVGYAYFDLASDPGERVDRYAAMRDRVGDLRELIDAYPEAAAATKRALSGKKGALSRREQAPFALDPEREEKLRALGYLE